MALLLVDRAEEILSLLAPGGSLVLSGILEADACAVEEAFSARGRPTRRFEGEWTALVYEGEPA
jgi:ribosomal protein L11 methyltransferase